MNRTVTVAVPDHNCPGFNGCPVCRDFMFARSRQKWNALQEKWALVRQRMNRPYQPDAMVIAAIMSPTEEEKQNARA
jgi:hypothetical protein